MKCRLVRRVVVITIGLCLGLFTTAKAETSPQTQPSVRAFKVAPSYFIPNTVPSKNGKGQSAQLLKNNPEAIAFIQTRKGRVIFTPTGAYIGMNVKIPSGRPEKSDIDKALKPEMGHLDETKIKTVVMKTGFSIDQIKAQRTPKVHMEELTGAKVNFLVGTKGNWHTSIPTYRKLVYDNVWTGIDVEYLGYMDRLEYRLQLKPGADPKQINIETGAKKLTLNEDGSLTAALEGGQLTMSTPKAWQNIDGKQVPVDVDFQVLDNGCYTFTLGAYDHSHALTIDPVLVWSTYLVDKPGEGTDNEEGHGIAMDATGASYITGITDSSDFPTTAGALQTVYHVNDDAFVTKLSPDGGALVYSTYLGGSGTDFGQSIAVDSAGAAYVTGVTKSSDFPHTAGAFQPVTGGGRDAFVTKLSADGSALVYSTYLGGSDFDSGNGIAVDSTGAAYVTGDTRSSDFPTTDGAFQTSCGGGVSYVYDAFVTKLSADGSALVYSTYLGGSSEDRGTGIAVDSAGEAYVTGYTGSSDFPATDGAFQTSCGGGVSYVYDAIVTKLSADGSALVYSTYLGGSSEDRGTGIAVDSAGEAYVTGYTGSSDFPATDGAFQTAFSGSANYIYDAFVTKLSEDGSALVYSTYLGGSSEDRGTGIAVDSAGEAYVTGYTGSSDFPATDGAFQTAFSGGTYYAAYDAFVTKLSEDGRALAYSTYLGGSSEDRGFGIAVGNSDSAYVTGFTSSTAFPTTTGAFGPTAVGENDAFVTKLSVDGSELVYSTYLGKTSQGGASSSDSGDGIAVDSAGAVYITGYTDSSDFPATSGAFQRSCGGGIPYVFDTFVTKLSMDGSTLVYSTYLGGSDDDVGYGIAVDSAGSAYVTGYSRSSDFPTTSGAFHTVYGGGYRDAFVAKLSADGNTLVYSTYLGGNDQDEGRGIALNSGGSAYITGITQSSDFPTTTGAFQTDFGGGRDAFVTELSTDGSTLVYSTYLGGSEFDNGNSIAVDSTGAAYVTGGELSPDFPTTTGAFQTTFSGEGEFGTDAFVTKLSADGSTLVYSTYLGGSDEDRGTGIAVDSAGAAYITGYTGSLDFPTSAGAFQTVIGGYTDAFVTKLSKDGSALDYSTYLGGNDSDYGASIAVNSNGAAYVTGDTRSSDFPTTPVAFGPTVGEYNDAFVMKLLPDGSALLYSTCLGGMGYDIGNGIAIDSTGAAYVTGYTDSSDFPTTAGVFGTTSGKYVDVFVAKLDFSGEVFHRITVTADTNGTIFPGSKDMVEGSDATFAIVPDIGYEVSDVQVDGVSVGAVTSYTFSNVTADHTISASFALQPPLTLPLPTLLCQGKAVSFLDSIDTLLVNPYAEDANVTVEGRDENGQVISQTSVTVTGNGSLQVNPLTEGTGEPASLWARADRHLLVFERLHHPNGEMTAYLNTPLQHQLTVPHVAEETDWWDSWAYLSNTNPRSLTLTLAGQDEDLQAEPSMYVNLEAHLPNPVSENDAWGQIVSGADNPFSNTNTLSGFEMFIQKDSDGAACELIGKASYTLRVPHIPEETDIFWTGVAIVNVEEEAAHTTWTFYSDNGTVVGTETLTIPPESKLKGLMTGLFPDESAFARWATISSDRKLAGIEIYGTHDGGICGLVLPGDTATSGILPDVRTQEGEWTGIAITNPMTANAHVSIQLVSATGVVKANRTETIAPLNRFKAVVADYFEGTVIEDGDTVRFLSDQPVIALEVCGDLDRTFMTALTTGR